MRGLAGCAVLWLALGCAGRSVGGGDAGSDAGRPADAGAPRDGGAPTDAATPALDAGSDASAPGCACPPLPTTCVPPSTTVPAFTPDATAVASQLFSVIACAEGTLSVAVYEATWECLRDALQAALDRSPGLLVELVVDDRECAVGSCFADELLPRERVTVRRDERSGLMHLKLAIADGDLLWIGSTNFTERSFCTDYNDALVIDDPTIVARYVEVFDRLFVSGEFGPVAPEGPTTSGPYTAYFSPESPTAAPAEWMTAMADAIGAATTSVDVMIFAWTRTELSDALVAAAARGVRVRALVAGAYADDAPARALLAAGIDLRVATVHSKAMIVDGATVITGSANWSENAWSNNEHSLWVAEPAIAAAYGARFDAIFAGAAAPAP